MNTCTCNCHKGHQQERLVLITSTEEIRSALMAAEQLGRILQADEVHRNSRVFLITAMHQPGSLLMAHLPDAIKMSQALFAITGEIHQKSWTRMSRNKKAVRKQHDFIARQHIKNSAPIRARRLGR